MSLSLPVSTREGNGGPCPGISAAEPPSSHTIIRRFAKQNQRLRLVDRRQYRVLRESFVPLSSNPAFQYYPETRDRDRERFLVLRQHWRNPMAGIDHGRPLPAATAAMPRTLPSDAAFAKPRGGARVLAFILQTFVMAVALALFFLFAGVAAVVLLHLLVAGRTLRRRSRNGPLFPNAADDASPAGLSVAQLNGLPWFEYSGPSASPPWPPPDCAVCLEGFKKGERCRALPSCGHVFHVACVDRWLAKSRGCPICRALVGVA
ncbi:hypothetical protein C4D60_Mb11t07480 [Musa balbisiana]|uniref:RING-type domain-containing protein n=1 Tax=Musa balbisiana TaxID=52838 RepID=A0A4S8J3X3_MUSBA|nr:hypothetical protein C4D60_Mb11t07480 [Musa balbisiana]